MKLHYAPLSSSEAPIKRSFRGSQILSAMCLEVLRLSQRDRPKTRPSRARQKRPALDSSARRARRSEMAGRGPRHRRPPQPLAVQSRVMLTRAIRPGARSRTTAWRAGAARPKPGSHNVGLDGERRVDLGATCLLKKSEKERADAAQNHHRANYLHEPPVLLMPVV